MLYTILNIITTILGAITLVGLLAYFAIWAYGELKDIKNRQSKIRCLCKHEYVKDWIWPINIYTEYGLVCRKCGKKKKITIYNDEAKWKDIF